MVTTAKRTGWRISRGLALALAMVLTAGSALGEDVKPKPKQGTERPKVRPMRAAPGRIPGLEAKEEAKRIAAPEEAPDTTGKPRINCEQPVHDFGETWIGPVLKHAYKIKNEGEAPLEITRVRPSCGCTIAGTYPRTILPGDEGEFPFSVDSKKLHGKFEKAVTIYSNDPINPSYRVRLRGRIKRYVDITPPNIHFGKILGEDRAVRIVKFTNNTEEPLKVNLKTPAPKGFEYDLRETEPGKVFELSVAYVPPFETGIFRRIIELTTNKEGQRNIKIDVRGEVPQRLEVNPPVLAVNVAQRFRQAQDRGVTRIVRLSNYGDNPVKLLEAECSDPKVQVDVLEQLPGKSYTVRVQFPAEYQAPPGGAKLTLKTDDKIKPTIEVPIRGAGPQRVADRKRQQEQRKRPAEQLVGKPAPAFSATTTAGESFTSSDLKGKITVIDFWAPNCGFCKKQIPRLEKVRQEYEGKDDVRFVAVSQTMRKRYSDEEVVNVLNSLGFRGELVIDSNNTIGPPFKATSYPTMVVVGKDAKIAAVNIGNMAMLEEELKKQLDGLLGTSNGGATNGKKTAAADKPAAPEPKQPAKPEARNEPRPTTVHEWVGKEAPDFEFETIDGKKLSKADLSKHKAVVLNVVAANCGFCKKQIPRVEKLRQDYEAKGVKFVNVVETMRKRYTQDEIVDVMKSIGSHLDLAHDPSNQVGRAFSVRGFPTMVVLDNEGKVRAANVGNMGNLEERLQAQLDALIAGKEIPKTAAAPRTPPKREQPRRGQPTDLIGKDAPDFEFETLDGQKVTKADLKDSPAIVLNVVAANCGFCKKQIPRLEKIRQEYESKGIKFFNVVETMRQRYTVDQVKDVMSNIGSTMALAHDPNNTIGQKFSVRGFPTMVVLSKEGKVAAVNVGNRADLENVLKQQFDALIAGKPIPESALAKSQPNRRRRPAEEMAGKPAPSMTLTTTDGDTISSEDFDDHKATVLNFVAPNCGFCKRQVPGVEKVRQEYEMKGVRFVNVQETMRKEYSPEEAEKIFKDAGSNLDLAPDKGNAVGRQYKVTSFPTMFVVDSSGKIVHVNIGAKQNLDQMLRNQLDQLIKQQGS